MKKKVNAEFPDKLRFLFDPHRYKVARGGRGSTKSWSFARAILLLGAYKTLRVLCTREVQKSIKDSVHKLLSDQIKLLALESLYAVTEVSIKGRKNNTEIIFSGLSDQTADSIKSFEGIDICWVEEAHVVSKKSWDILIPTIRKIGSEIWISYNPDLESDETHQRFTIHPPEDCINVLINWRDNPWWNAVLEAERVYCLKNDPDNYDNIWEGQCKPAVEGAIYFKQIQKMEQENRICSIPYDPLLNVHVVVDLGWEDLMFFGLVQRDPVSVRIIDEVVGRHITIPEFSIILKDRPYNWGKVWLPWDGYSKNPDNGLSSADTFRNLGWDVPEKDTVINLSVEEGIKETRLMFQRLYIDKQRCPHLIESLKRYRRHINTQTGAPGSPVHDDYSHGADMLRGLASNVKQMQNSTNLTYVRPPRSGQRRTIHGR